MTTTTYTFADTRQAQQRLAELADVFAPTSEDFVRRCVPYLHSSHHLLDVGCGPGHTTVLTAKLVAPHRVTAIDASAAMVAACRRRLAAQADPVLCQADVRVLDVSTLEAVAAPVDVAYCRHLLAHVSDPADAMARVGHTLAIRGTALFEETAGMETDDPALSEYYALLARMQAEKGQDTFVGARLHQLAARAGLRVCEVVVLGFTVSIATVASLHAANIRVWGPQAVRGGLAQRETVQTLEQGLRDRSYRGKGVVQVRVGQARLERPGPGPRGHRLPDDRENDHGHGGHPHPHVGVGDARGHHSHDHGDGGGNGGAGEEGARHAASQPQT